MEPQSGCFLNKSAASSNIGKSTYLFRKYGERFSLYREASNTLLSKAHETSRITTDSVKIGHHSYMKDTISICVPRKYIYRRLCGSSLYEVSKYSYDDKNHYWISSSCKIEDFFGKILSSESEGGDRNLYFY